MTVGFKYNYSSNKQISFLSFTRNCKDQLKVTSPLMQGRCQGYYYGDALLKINHKRNTLLTNLGVKKRATNINYFNSFNEVGCEQTQFTCTQKTDVVKFANIIQASWLADLSSLQRYYKPCDWPTVTVLMNQGEVFSSHEDIYRRVFCFCCNKQLRAVWVMIWCSVWRFRSSSDFRVHLKESALTAKDL